MKKEKPGLQNAKSGGWGVSERRSGKMGGMGKDWGGGRFLVKGSERT